MNNQPTPSALPFIVLFAWIVVASTALCVFLYLSAAAWK
jgi:hypothetical protein